MSVIEKDPEGNWIYQLSLKLGPNNAQMLNVRAKSWQEFMDALKLVTENSEDIKDASYAFAELPGAPSFQAPLPSVPLADARATPPPQTNGKADEGQEIGPMVVSKVDVINGVAGPDSKNPGKPYTLYKIVFGNGAVKASTFNATWGQAAMNLLGKSAYPRVTNKTKWGYDLVSIRTAA